MFKITPKNTIFVLLSFEGPDLYSLAGGLGVRMTELSETLAKSKFTTHLFFIGDPKKTTKEKLINNKLILHRWCQKISEKFPLGIYQGEKEKVAFFEKNLPIYVASKIIQPAVVKNNKFVVILSEEWQTARTLINIYRELKKRNLTSKTVLFWNANNIFGFSKINWKSLNKISTITTVSRYMKCFLLRHKVNPLVIPNGIPRRLLKEISLAKVNSLRKILKDRIFLFKIGRYDPSKRWIMAIEAIAKLKKLKHHPILLIRGGMGQKHRVDIIKKAKNLNLKIKTLELTRPDWSNILNILNKEKKADILELNFYISEEILRIFYRAADAVLANSVHEPFGLVGLEAMAAKGIVFTGASGEDYARSLENSLVVETNNSEEIVIYLLDFLKHPSIKKRIRKKAYLTAKDYIWNKVIQELIYRLELAASLK